MKFGINFFPSFRPEDSTTADYYAQCLRLAERADALGYHSLKTVEHSFFDYGGHSPNPCVFLSAIAARTKRVRLTTGAVIPAFHHPAHLGGDLAMLDAWQGHASDQYPGYDKMVASIIATTPEKIVANGGAFVGTPDEVAAQVQSCIDTFGRIEPSMQINFGGSTDHDAFRTLELFASQVMPRFR